MCQKQRRCKEKQHIAEICNVEFSEWLNTAAKIKKYELSNVYALVFERRGFLHFFGTPVNAQILNHVLWYVCCSQ